MEQTQHTEQPRKRRGGRPRLSPDERRSIQIKVGLTPSQYVKIEERAESAGLSDVELIRRLAISQQFNTVPAINRSALIELNKIGINLNQIAKAVNSGADVNFEKALESIKYDIKEIAQKLY